jgi:hypothetical protein
VGGVHVRSIPECVTSTFRSAIGSGTGKIGRAAGFEFAEARFSETLVRTMYTAVWSEYETKSEGASISV